MPAESAVGTKITTIEGINGKVAQAVQAAWQKLDVVQCGYCQSGQIMSAVALLTDNRNPTDSDIDAAMDGNVCRCATYPRIRAAIKDAAKAVSGGAGGKGDVAHAGGKDPSGIPTALDLAKAAATATA